MRFYSENQPIPLKHFDLIVTSDEDTDKQYENGVIRLRYEDLGIETVPNIVGLIARNHSSRFQKMLIGIDPGEKIGVAAICDGMTLSAKTVSIKNLNNVIQSFLLTFPSEAIIIRIGDKPISMSNVIFNRIFQAFQKVPNVRLEIVNEAASNVKTTFSQQKYSLDEKAAITIGFREGQPKTHMVRNAIPPGRVKEIQNWSRKVSGNITLDSKLAELVALGKISIEDALKVKTKGNDYKKEQECKEDT
jgi:hypothetical protein